MKSLIAALSLALLSTAAMARDAYTPAPNIEDPFRVVTPFAAGSSVKAGSALLVTCSAGGNVSVTLSNGNNLVLAVPTGSTQVFPLAVTQVTTAGTTGTCTYAQLSGD